MVPVSFGVLGYIAPLVVITASYALFQTANNTIIMTTSRLDQRGVISGLLNLSRNLGLITGASVMGALFALGSATNTITTARPEAVAADYAAHLRRRSSAHRRRARHRVNKLRAFATHCSSKPSLAGRASIERETSGRGKIAGFWQSSPRRADRLRIRRRMPY